MENVCISVIDAPASSSPITFPQFPASSYAEYILSWNITNTDVSPISVTIEYFYLSNTNTEVGLYSSNFTIAAAANNTNSTTVNFNAPQNNNAIYARVTFDGQCTMEVCVQEGDYILDVCGSEGYAFKDGPYWHISRVFSIGTVNEAYSFAANSTGVFNFFYFWDFDDTPSGENFTITISVIDTQGVISPVVLSSGGNTIVLDSAITTSGTSQINGTYNVQNPDSFIVEIDGLGAFFAGFRLVCDEIEQSDENILSECCKPFANSTENCFEWTGAGTTDLIAPSPVLPELVHCAPVGCNCIPVYIDPTDPENSYKNDFSSFLFNSPTTLTYSLEKLVNGVWIDQGAFTSTIYNRGDFPEYPNRTGIVINWIDIGETGTFRLKIGNETPLYSLPHCVELYNCHKNTIRFTGEWTQNFTNYRFKDALNGDIQFVEFQDMPFPWPYQIRYNGTLGEFGIDSEEKDVITYYDDRNNLHYEKQKENIQACILDSLLDLMQRHVYYVAKGSTITLDEYSILPIDSTQYLRNYPVIFESFDGAEYGEFNERIPKFLVKYYKRNDNMVFSV